jgi:uncharacterized SAM-binding protein YcdF (DUF218 family)
MDCGCVGRFAGFHNFDCKNPSIKNIIEKKIKEMIKNDSLNNNSFSDNSFNNQNNYNNYENETFDIINNTNKKLIKCDKIASFLSFSPPYDNYEKSINNEYDIIVLCGNYSKKTFDITNDLWNNNKNQIPIIITGGKGRSTEPLREYFKKIANDDMLEFLFSLEEQNNNNNIYNVKLNKEIKSYSNVNLYQKYTIDNASESEMIVCILNKIYNIPLEYLYIEKLASNTGENAIFTIPFLMEFAMNKNKKINVAIIQHSFMLRRTLLTFLKIAKDLQMKEHLIFTPISYNEKSLDSSLINDELKKIQNNQDGYGPKGKNFIDDVGELPEF